MPQTLLMIYPILHKVPNNRLKKLLLELHQMLHVLIHKLTGMKNQVIQFKRLKLSQKIF